MIWLAAVLLILGCLAGLGLRGPARLAALGVLILGLGGYALRGAPEASGTQARHSMPDTPGARAAAAQARTRLLKDPADIPAWIALSVALGSAGKTEQAAEGLTRALAAMPDQPDLWVALGESLVAHNKGLVSPAARLAFDRASRIAPDHPAPRYYLGLAWLQAGKPDQALETWQALLAATPADAPWRDNIVRKVKAAQTMIAAGVGQ